MIEYISVLKNSELFNNIPDADILPLLHCLKAKILYYKKEQPIFLAGDNIKQFGIVLEGKIKIQKDDINGNTSYIEEQFPSDIFALAFVCAGINKSPVSIFATPNTKIILFYYITSIHSCSAACSFHSKLIENMLKVTAKRMMKLTQKINIIQKTTIREKLLAYFETFMESSKVNKFTIPISRNELAEFLGVNRSALSRELSNMKNDGIISFSKNKFTIIK